MVEEPSAYSCSSYSINADCIKSDLKTPHPEVLALGQTKGERLNSYRELFKALYRNGIINRDKGKYSNKGRGEW
ncbi:MAG: hypothetical protein VSS75_013695 [Candidatus Parabeggiatoa sp.]|nr:hypothetical protein [Candidatus Parabeggiatoa sp.]